MGVPESWTTIQKDWAKNGPEFFIQLFKKYPDAQEEFPSMAGQDEAALRANPALAQQAENLRKGMDSLIMNLSNKDALDFAMEKLATRHKEREMDEEYFKKAFNFFLDFNKDVAGFDRNQWQIVLDDCYKRISGKMVL